VAICTQFQNTGSNQWYRRFLLIISSIEIASGFNAVFNSVAEVWNSAIPKERKRKKEGQICKCKGLEVTEAFFGNELLKLFA
jgi:hypothetical protein